MNIANKENKNLLGKLLNKVNPVGGRFDLNSASGIEKFYEEAYKVAKKYKLQVEFEPINF